VFFQLSILPAGGPSASTIDIGWKKRIRYLLFFVFLTSLAWMLNSSANMAESWAPREIWLAVSETSFGRYWCFRIGVLLALSLGAGALLRTRKGLQVLGGIILILPLISTLTGHAGAAESNIFLRVGTDWIHAVTVGIWCGGLLSLFLWIGAALKSSNTIQQKCFPVVRRFSHVAMASTALIAMTGLLMTYSAGVSFSRPWETNYGKIILGKVLFFAIALGAAAVNQFSHLRNWKNKIEVSSARAVRRTVAFELAVTFAVLIMAGFLTRFGPPGPP
jgi:putative copper export protein